MYQVIFRCRFIKLFKLLPRHFCNPELSHTTLFMHQSTIVIKSKNNETQLLSVNYTDTLFSIQKYVENTFNIKFNTQQLIITSKLECDITNSNSEPRAKEISSCESFNVIQDFYANKNIWIQNAYYRTDLMLSFLVPTKLLL